MIVSGELVRKKILLPSLSEIPTKLCFFFRFSNASRDHRFRDKCVVLTILFLSLKSTIYYVLMDKKKNRSIIQKTIFCKHQSLKSLQKKFCYVKNLFWFSNTISIIFSISKLYFKSNKLSFFFLVSRTRRNIRNTEFAITLSSCVNRTRIAARVDRDRHSMQLFRPCFDPQWRRFFFLDQGNAELKQINKMKREVSEVCEKGRAPRATWNVLRVYTRIAF